MRSGIVLSLLSLLLLVAGGANSAATDVSDVALSKIDAFIEEQAVNKQAGWRSRLSKPPRASFDPKKTYKWNLETNEGLIVVKLKPETAPMHVSSTIYLTRLGFYDGVSFHRIIPNFMAQGGDPEGTGRGGPGYTYDGEFDDKVKHDKGGMLSMANSGPGTDGSQFFLTFTATPWLDGKHTIFGEVVDGTEVLKKIEKLGTRGSGRPRARVEIKKATISVE